ncbi:GTP-binding protein 10 like [Pseudolycoriella hygida]|uniref:GTP-binding protein 10 like n=1 Tax=Pseudolycoriella hygida TaxID=35572 RepID=A0A9Q0S7A8_9DIPT|nr:GTP-binding protein 10 like [Pseudolycoriella hygida]
MTEKELENSWLFHNSFLVHKGQKSCSLDLKLRVNARLVGFPKAGKSTSIKVNSNARPKVAVYLYCSAKNGENIQDVRTAIRNVLEIMRKENYNKMKID